MDKARAPGAPGKRGVAKTFGARRICLELAVLVLVGLQVVLGAQLKPTSITMGGKTGALESGAAAGPLLLGVKPDSGPLFDKYGVEIQFRNNGGDVILYGELASTTCDDPLSRMVLTKTLRPTTTTRRQEGCRCRCVRGDVYGCGGFECLHAAVGDRHEGCE